MPCTPKQADPLHARRRQLVRACSRAQRGCGRGGGRRVAKDTRGSQRHAVRPRSRHYPVGISSRNYIERPMGMQALPKKPLKPGRSGPGAPESRDRGVSGTGIPGTQVSSRAPLRRTPRASPARRTSSASCLCRLERQAGRVRRRIAQYATTPPPAAGSLSQITSPRLDDGHARLKLASQRPGIDIGGGCADRLPLTGPRRAGQRRQTRPMRRAWPATGARRAAMASPTPFDPPCAIAPVMSPGVCRMRGLC